MLKKKKTFEYILYIVVFCFIYVLLEKYLIKYFSLLPSIESIKHIKCDSFGCSLKIKYKIYFYLGIIIFISTFTKKIDNKITYKIFVIIISFICCFIFYWIFQILLYIIPIPCDFISINEVPIDCGEILISFISLNFSFLTIYYLYNWVTCKKKQPSPTKRK